MPPNSAQHRRESHRHTPTSSWRSFSKYGRVQVSVVPSDSVPVAAVRPLAFGRTIDLVVRGSVLVCAWVVSAVSLDRAREIDHQRSDNEAHQRSPTITRSTP